MSSLPINIIDIIILVVILISAILAFSRGFIQEVLSILGWIGGAVIAYFASFSLLPFALNYIQDPRIAQIVAGILVFIVALFILSFIAGKISMGVKGSTLNAVDRSLGFVFGTFRGIVIILIMFMAAEGIAPNLFQNENFVQAKSTPIFHKFSEKVRVFFEKKSDHVELNLDQLKKTVMDGSAEISTVPSRETPKEFSKPETAATIEAVPLGAPGEGAPGEAPADSQKTSPEGTADGYNPQDREGLDALVKQNN